MTEGKGQILWRREFTKSCQLAREKEVAEE